MRAIAVKPAAKERVRRAAFDLGFLACGFTHASRLDSEPLLQAWLAAGRHGDMDYLALDPPRRLDPQRALEGCASVIVAAWPYRAPAARPDWRQALTGRLAAYCLGLDYHDVLREKLEELAEVVRAAGGTRARIQVDSGFLLEKELARRAGLGWYGHHTNLLLERGGSYVLLACLLTDARFESDPAFRADRCGSCRACVPACPTGALDTPPTIDARRCISYLTIEHRGPIEPALRPHLGNWVFGCDICQQVCPWNEHEPVAQDFLNPSLVELLELDEDGFRQRYRRTAVARTKRRGLARNAAVALGNSANPQAVGALERAGCVHDEALVRAHAAWALGRLPGRASRAALGRMASRPQAPPVRREIELAMVDLRRGFPEPTK